MIVNHYLLSSLPNLSANIPGIIAIIKAKKTCTSLIPIYKLLFKLYLFVKK